MGICCDKFDVKLERMIECEKSDSFLTVCSSKDFEEKVWKVRREKSLKTICEDNREDLSSPFSAKLNL